MRKNTFLFTTLVSLFLAAPVFADESPVESPEVRKERANSVNLSPLGVLVGSYTLNYERLFGHHGLLVEGSLFAQSDDDASSAGLGFAAGYRLHLNGRQNSWFVGVNAGLSLGTGDAEVESGGMREKFEVDVHVLSVVGNVGKRWAWNNGLNLTIRLGAGYGNYSITTESRDPDARQAVKEVDDLLTTIPVAVDGELSLGYTF